MLLERIIEIITEVETTDLQNLLSLKQIPQKQLVDILQSRVPCKSWEWLLHEAPVAPNVGGYAALRISTR
jgi:hypothetical protein